MIISGDITVRNLLSLGFKFGLVKENRLVIGSHMVRLEESVKKAGIFVNSIKVETADNCVREKLSVIGLDGSPIKPEDYRTTLIVIDGQNRLFSILKLYSVNPQAIEECMVTFRDKRDKLSILDELKEVNVNQEKWGPTDYLKLLIIRADNIHKMSKHTHVLKWMLELREKYGVKVSTSWEWATLKSYDRAREGGVELAKKSEDKVETEALLKFVNEHNPDNETLFITVMNYFGLSLVRDRSISSVFVDIYQEQRDPGKRTSLKAISRITEFLAQLPKDTPDYLKGIKTHANEIGGKYGGKESELRREYLYGLWKEFKKDRNY